VNRLRFALASCQDLREGFYPAYRDVAEQNLDFVVHVGDYIYENGPTDVPIAEGRNHNGPEIVSVDDYRNRYALYRLRAGTPPGRQARWPGSSSGPPAGGARRPRR
jgi:alkaline phosphatase D